MNARGFTLLELLVAIAVFSVIGLASYSALDTVLNTNEAVSAQTRRLAEVQSAEYWLAQDIGQIVARPVRDDSGQSQPALRLTALDDALIRFTRGGRPNPLDRPRSSMQRVAYFLREDVLYRGVFASLDPGLYQEPELTALIEGVDDVQFRVLTGGGAWEESWPPESDGAPLLDVLPAGIEVTLTLKDWGEIPRLYLLTGTP